MGRELLFSVTAADCRFDYYRGSGKGGQKKNKTSSAARCTHVASGAVGCCEDTRSQTQNKQTAFKRMAETEKFKVWHRMEVARRTGALQNAKEYAETETQPHKIRVEGKDENGRWTPIEA